MAVRASRNLSSMIWCCRMRATMVEAWKGSPYDGSAAENLLINMEKRKSQCHRVTEKDGLGPITSVTASEPAVLLEFGPLVGSTPLVQRQQLQRWEATEFVPRWYPYR